jgi:hypothetical protein
MASARTALRIKYGMLNIMMRNVKVIDWVLRIGIAGEFIGHGVFALEGKKDWVGWFAKFGVPDPALAAKILFVIGLVDIALAIIVLVRPIPWLLLWMAFWGFWTALMRPIVGLEIWDFVERFANWSAPLALYFILKDREGQ